MSIRGQVVQLLLAVSSVDSLSSSHALSASAVLNGPGKDAAKANAAGKQTAQAEGAGKLFAVVNDVGREAGGSGKQTAIETGTGRHTAVEGGSGKQAAQAVGAGKQAAQEAGAGKQAAQEAGAGKQAAQAVGAGKQAALEAGAGKQAAQEAGAGKQVAQDAGVGRQVAQDAGAGKQVAQEAGAGKQAAQAAGAGKQAAQLGGPGKQAALASGAGQATAIKREAGVKTAIRQGAGVATAQEKGAGVATAQKRGVGVTKAQASGVGYDNALEQGKGREVALKRAVGKAAAIAEGTGRATALLNTRSQCLGANPNYHDIGYLDAHRGWYDIQGCGKCEDYCRWVGQDAGSGGDPSQTLIHGQAWWSCRLAGSEEVYTSQNHFTSFPHKRCAYRGQDTCFLPQDTEVDGGFNDDFRGWYDVQGCGTCNDYCRWIGNSGSGGDPSERRAMGDSYWSCRLAGSNITSSVSGYFSEWNFKKCKSKGQESCKPASTSEWDDGYRDDYRGWYDLQGCGSCNDYCRWVGLDGSGGDPAKQLENGKSWWSCRLAGTSTTYTERGHFQSWNYTLCNNGPGIRAAHAQHSGQKTAVSKHVGQSEAKYEQAGVSAALSGA